jgi:hypothetical protein
MTLPFDPGQDLAQVADGLQTATFTRPKSGVSAVVAHALRSVVRARQIAESAGRYTSSDVAWHLPAAEMPVEPRAGDVIVDADDRRWTVLDVEKTTLAARWRCVARNLAVVHGLDAYVDVEEATLTKGQAGAETRVWRTWKTGLSARIQPVATEIRSEHDRQVSRARFTIFLAHDLALDRRHRVRGPDGTLYRVVAVRKADRIDALTEIDVVRTS